MSRWPSDLADPFQISKRDLETVRRVLRVNGRKKFGEFLKQLVEREPKKKNITRRGAPRQSLIRQALFVALYRKRHCRVIAACARSLHETFHIAFLRSSNTITQRTNYPFGKRQSLDAIKDDLSKGLRALNNQGGMQNLVEKVSEGFPFLARALLSSGRHAAVSFLGTTVILSVKNPGRLDPWIAALQQQKILRQ